MSPRLCRCFSGSAVCPTEIAAFSDRVKEFSDIGCQVVAASIDSKFSNLAWTQQPRAKGGLGKMAIPIISDVSKAFAKALGCVIEGADDGDAGVTFRATYIIDPSGTIRSVQVRGSDSIGDYGAAGDEARS